VTLGTSQSNEEVWGKEAYSEDGRWSCQAEWTMAKARPPKKQHVLRGGRTEMNGPLANGGQPRSKVPQRKQTQRGLEVAFNST